MTIFACFVVGNLHSSVSSSSNRSDTPETPVTPHNLLKKLTSSFRLIPSQTWQQEIAEMLAPKCLRCTSSDQKHLNISGTFKVDERSWTVLSDKNIEAKFPWGPVIKDWTFSIEVEQVLDNRYRLTIKNPDIKYARNPGKIFDVEANNLLNSISQLLRVLDPRSPIYSE